MLANKFKSVLSGYQEREKALIDRCKTLEKELSHYKNLQ